MIPNKFFKKNAFIFLVPLAALFLAQVSYANTEIVVGLERAGVKKTPSLLAPTLGFLKYGDKAKVVSKKTVWYQITFKNKKGWLHSSATGKSSAILKDIGRGEKVSAESYKDEAVAAGKGFSKEYEEFYRKGNPKADFKTVDELEKRKVTKKELIRFIKEGQLKSSLLTEAQQ